MTRAIKAIMERLMIVFMMICVFSGIILMMCESPDWETQRMTLLGGFGLFLLGLAPAAIIAALNTKKEKKNDDYYG